MTVDYFFNFKKNLYEAEQEAESEPDLEKVLRKSPKVVYTLMKLLTSQKEVNASAQKEIRDIVSDIKMISYRPTTFRIIFKNSNYFDLVYDPTPLQIKREDGLPASDLFKVAIAGKRYDLANKSSFEQALDYVGQALKYNPIDSSNPDTQQADSEDGGSTDLPDETDKPNA
jgi:hypothetical protein